MNVKIRNTSATLTLDENGRLLMLTANKVICEDGLEAPDDPLARAQHFADPANAYGTVLTIQFSYGQEGDPRTLADGLLAVLGL